MKRRLEHKIVPAWEEEKPFRVPLRQCVPVARSSPDGFDTTFFRRADTDRREAHSFGLV